MIESGAHIKCIAGEWLDEDICSTMSKSSITGIPLPNGCGQKTSASHAASGLFPEGGSGLACMRISRLNDPFTQAGVSSRCTCGLWENAFGVNAVGVV